MFDMNNLLFFVLLPLIIDTFQMNLYYTEDEYVFQHDCLRVDIFGKKKDQHLHSFCMSESSMKLSNGSFHKFTFLDLFKANITIQQLYFWSASIDTLENYQFYLNQQSTSNDSSLKYEDFLQLYIT